MWLIQLTAPCLLAAGKEVREEATRDWGPHGRASKAELREGFYSVGSWRRHGTSATCGVSKTMGREGDLEGDFATVLVSNGEA